MYSGLTNNDTRPAFIPDTVVTIGDGHLVYRGPTALHPFGRLTGTVTDIAVDDAKESVDIYVVAATGRNILVTLPVAAPQTLRMLLPLASAKRFAGSHLNIDVTPERKDGAIRAAIRITDGEDDLAWAVPKEEIPRGAEGRMLLVRQLAGDIRTRLEHERGPATIPRVAPDIDDVPEGL